MVLIRRVRLVLGKTAETLCGVSKPSAGVVVYRPRLRLAMGCTNPGRNSSGRLYFKLSERGEVRRTYRKLFVELEESA